MYTTKDSNMRSLPLNTQIIAAPLVLAVPIIIVLIFTLFYLADISKQNDAVREWSRATDQFSIAKSANYQMLHILKELHLSESSTATSLKTLSADKTEELFFNYIEQSQFLNSSLMSTDIRDKISKNNLAFFTSILKNIEYSESINIQTTITLLESLNPKLEYIFNTLQAKKRGLYVDSNHDITDITAKLTNIISLVLGIAVFLALFISIFVSKNINRRLASINQYATDILQGNFKTLEAPTQIKDEIDQVTLKLSKMSQRLTHTMESELILQSAEDERQRIAMDIHDQFLSEISQLRRNIKEEHSNKNYNEQLTNIDNTLERLNIDLRALINDLFPHSLEMLGLEAAIRDYTERKISSLHNIDYYINIDNSIDSLLSTQQCLHIYRISIEIINNILKHAHCSRFELSFKVINDKLSLTIEDNGCGFDFLINNQQGHIGILSVKQRTSILEANATWKKSRFSSGTCFQLKLTKSIIKVNPLTTVFKTSPQHA